MLLWSKFSHKAILIQHNNFKQLTFQKLGNLTFMVLFCIYKKHLAQCPRQTYIIHANPVSWELVGKCPVFPDMSNPVPYSEYLIRSCCKHWVHCDVSTDDLFLPREQPISRSCLSVCYNNLSQTKYDQTNHLKTIPSATKVRGHSLTRDPIVVHLNPHSCFLDAHIWVNKNLLLSSPYRSHW